MVMESQEKDTRISDLQGQVKSLNNLLNSGDDGFEATRRMREYVFLFPFLRLFP
jgi:hypothetical protein